MTAPGGHMIGIVGGVGPFAGLDLQQKILQHTRAIRDQDHLAVLSLSHPGPVHDRTEFLLGQVKTNPAYALAEQIQLLAQAGAMVAGIPCNTAHAPAIFDVIRAELDRSECPIRLLHMIEEVGRFLHETHPGLQQVGILSTTGTYRAGFYPAILAAAGFTAVIPDERLQVETIHPAIYDSEFGIKACGTVTAEADMRLRQGIQFLQQQGAEAVVLGCTEIPLAITETRLGDTLVVDPTTVLARALIREACPDRLK